MAVDTSEIWVLNPFSPLQDNTVLKITEEHEIKRIDALGGSFYGIQLDYVPASKQLPDEYKDSPTDDLKTQILTTPGGTQLVEVGRTQNPSVNQYRVDYDNYVYGTGQLIANAQSTGLIEFNASREGDSVTVTYWSSGLTVKPQSFVNFLQGTTVPGPGGFGVLNDFTVGGNILVEGDVSIQGDLILETGSNAYLPSIKGGSAFDGVLDMLDHQIINLKDAEQNDEAVNLGQLQDAKTDVSQIKIYLGDPGSFAPAGTPIRLAWIEGILTGGSPEASVFIDLTSIFGEDQILTVQMVAHNSITGRWNYPDAYNEATLSVRDDSTQRSFDSRWQETGGIRDYTNQPIRFLVHYKP